MYLIDRFLAIRIRTIIAPTIVLIRDMAGSFLTEQNIWITKMGFYLIEKNNNAIVKKTNLFINVSIRN